jgi:hypothetical protein
MVSDQWAYVGKMPPRALAVVAKPRKSPAAPIVDPPPPTALATPAPSSVQGTASAHPPAAVHSEGTASEGPPPPRFRFLKRATLSHASPDPEAPTSSAHASVAPSSADPEPEPKLGSPQVVSAAI